MATLVKPLPQPQHIPYSPDKETPYDQPADPHVLPRRGNVG